MLQNRRWFLAEALAAALLPAMPRLSEDTFTIAVVPDSQFEVVNAVDNRLADRFKWLTSHLRALNLKMVIHTGDIVNEDTEDHIQYERTSAAVKILDDSRLPYVLAIGNHDTAAPNGDGGGTFTDTRNNQRNTATFNRYFPASRHRPFEGVYERGKVDNGFRRFNAGGVKWLVINLEIWARTEAINWAKRVIQRYGDHNVILATHSFLNRDGAIDNRHGGHGDNTPRQIFDTLVKPYANVRIVLCGHTGSHAFREDAGAHGNKIYEILTAYHSRTDNPVRLLEIDTRRGTIKTRVYAPSTGKDRTDGSAFTVSGVDWVKSHTVDLNATDNLIRQHQRNCV